MQHYSNNDSYEREPFETPARRPIPAEDDYSSSGPSSPYIDASPRHPQRAAQMPYDSHAGSYRSPPPSEAPIPPRHGDNSYYTRGPPAHGEDLRHGNSMGATTGYGMNGNGRGTRESSMEASRSGSHLPPPPSRSLRNNNSQHGGGGYVYESYSGRGGDSPLRSQTSSIYHSGYSNDPYADDPYQVFSGSTRSVDRRLGEFNPQDIEDDGDDGLNYPRYNQRNSMLSSAANSDRGGRAAAGAAATGGVMGGLLGRNRESKNVAEYNLAEGAESTEKGASWGKKPGYSKKRKWLVILGTALIIVVIVVGCVAGALVHRDTGRGGGGDDRPGQSAKEDENENGDLGINSDEIKELLNNPDLHRVFPGMDYTPIHSQYPDCLHHPPSQNNVTRDMAVLSQLTNRIRTYGTDCNQTQMVIHALERLELQDDVKIWMGVWQDDNSTTNARQLDQMWDVLDEYGDEPFEGLIVANEILFREEMELQELSDLLKEVRDKLADKDWKLPVATSDLGDDWKPGLAAASDYIMSNIHPFFAGVPADEAAKWTMDFWNDNNGDMFKTDNNKNIIAETGWPTAGGTNCGQGPKNCKDGSVAGIDELNQFMDDWVCQRLKNGTNYFWFSAFDEPWKVAYNEDGKEWEDKWGLMDVNRNLKDGVVIPDCGGETI